MAERRYKAFISYSHRDKRVANWLHHALETYRLPLGEGAAQASSRLQPIFKDREELPAADSLGEAIEMAIQASDALIVLCSPAAATSPWIAREIDLYKRLNGDRNVFPVIVEGDPPNNFPAPLLQHYENGEPTGEAAEPIAADLRGQGDGKKLGKLKLVAGLAGVDLDSLVQRDAARKQKRLAFVASAALVGMVGTSALALYAIDQRDEAREQRAEADGLIEYMLTDLRKQLEPVGRLEVLDGVGQRAMDYYARQKLADLSDPELGRRARATMLVAEVQNLRGDNADALPAFEQAARTTEELLARDPDDPERMFNHGQSLFWVGYIAWQHGKMDAARKAMEGYAEISEALAAKDRSNLDWQMEEAYSQSNLGTMDFEAGKLEQALTHFERSREMTASVARAEGNSAARRKEVGESYSWISTTLFRLGRIEDALASREDEIAIYDRILAEDPRDNDTRRGRMFAQATMGRILALLGRPREAERALDEAISESESQIAAQPDDTLVKELVQGALQDRALLAWTSGRTDLAERFHARAVRNVAELRSRDGDNPSWNVTYPGDLAIERALTQGLGAKPETLRSTAKTWLARLDPEVRDHQWMIIACHLLQGIADNRDGRPRHAKEAFMRAYSQPSRKTEEVDYRSIALRAFAADRLGRAQDARSLRQQLAGDGIDPLIDDTILRGT